MMSIKERMATVLIAVQNSKDSEISNPTELVMKQLMWAILEQQQEIENMKRDIEYLQKVTKTDI